jgi:hypothetical protein
MTLMENRSVAALKIFPKITKVIGFFTFQEFYQRSSSQFSPIIVMKKCVNTTFLNISVYLFLVFHVFPSHQFLCFGLFSTAHTLRTYEIFFDFICL